MRKIFAAVVTSGIILCGSALARQAGTASSQQTPPASSQKNATGASGSATPAKSAGGTSAKSAASSGSAARSGTALVTKKDKQSYAIGANFGVGLRNQPLDLDPAIVAQGVKDALAGGKLAMTNDEARAVLTELQGELQKKQEAAMSQMGDTNKKEGAAFLAANKSKEGVVALPDGLQYKVVKAGNGPKPTSGDTVVCNYRGTLINGKEFDSSYKRGQPASFPVSGVIRGWTEALQLMPVGSKWELYVPSELAYGDRGAGPDIGPGATLVFEVELLSIQGKK
jgi:FKBP-type peptidyl-prolyl cis-trans isomerase FklB